MPTHVVEAGERLASIATDNDFENQETIWNAPENAELRAKRGGPSQVLPGDSVFIPEKQIASFEKPAKGVQTFQVHLAKVELHLRLQALLGEPIAYTVCKLSVDGTDKELITDGDGVVRFTVKQSAQNATLTVGDDTYQLAVGELDPLPDPSGAEGRLLNLGYLDAPLAGIDGEQQLSAALEQFQADHGLTVDGTLSDETLNALSEAHDG